MISDTINFDSFLIIITMILGKRTHPACEKYEEQKDVLQKALL